MVRKQLYRKGEQGLSYVICIVPDALAHTLWTKRREPVLPKVVERDRDRDAAGIGAGIDL